LGYLAASHPRVRSTFAHFSAFLTAICAALFHPESGHSQTSAEISTDRPDFVESAATVGSGRVQMETSFAMSNAEEGALATTTWTTPTLIRVGVTEVFELRLESDWLVRSETTPAIGLPDVTHGVADLSVGAKWHVRDQGHGLPALAVLVHADLPSGSEGVAGAGTRPSIRVSGEWDLGHEVGLGIMPGLRYDRDGPERFLSGVLGLAIGKGWTAKWGTFAELALEQVTRSNNGGMVGAVGMGATYLVNPFWQLDTALSFGLNDRSPDMGLTVGLSGVVVR
jgi:outer membrane putative beta-barrel porin/alpha-amylase